MAKRTKIKRDIAQEVTDKIIAALESGVAPWVKPWSNVGGSHMFPYNASSKTQYNGVNVLLLWLEAEAKGYASSGWMTFNQMKKLGGTIAKGTKSTLVTKWLFLEVEDKTKTDGSTKQIGIVKHFCVFNLDQITGLPERFYPKVEVLTVEEKNARIADAEAYVAATGATITEKGNEAFYHRITDDITVPALNQFDDSATYYSTVLHELVHWTGAKDRLDREKGQTFGDKVYAKEELIAELGSAFACAALGIEGSLRHEAYIANWLKELKGDKKFIFSAASKAKKAVAFMDELQPKAEEVEKTGVAA